MLWPWKTHNAQLPDQPCQNCQNHQGNRIETADEDQGREHHQVIPVEDPAGGAAAVFHHQTEGAPDQHADQVAYIEKYGDQKKSGLSKNPGEIKNADGSNQGPPDDENFISGLCCVDDIAVKGFVIDFILHGPEAAGPELLGAQRHLIPDGDDLLDHIHNPQQPKNMEKRKTGEKVQAVQNPEGFGGSVSSCAAKQKNKDTADQPDKVSLSCFGHEKAPV